MAEITSLTCPSCGSSLQSHNMLGKIECGYCRSVFTVKGEGRGIHLAPIVKELKNVQTGVDRTASELAINRLKNEIVELSETLKAVKEPENKEQNGIFGCFLMIALLIGLLTSWFGETGQNIGIILGIILAVVLIKVNIDEDKKRKQETKQKRNDYELQIEELQRQLLIHQDIVRKI